MTGRTDGRHISDKHKPIKLLYRLTLLCTNEKKNSEWRVTVLDLRLCAGRKSEKKKDKKWGELCVEQVRRGGLVRAWHAPQGHGSWNHSENLEAIP